MSGECVCVNTLPRAFTCAGYMLWAPCPSRGQWLLTGARCGSDKDTRPPTVGAASPERPAGRQTQHSPPASLTSAAMPISHGNTRNHRTTSPTSSIPGGRGHCLPSFFPNSHFLPRGQQPCAQGCSEEPSELSPTAHAHPPHQATLGTQEPGQSLGTIRAGPSTEAPASARPLSQLLASLLLTPYCRSP